MLYPNAHLEAVGTTQAQSDIDTCMQRAESAGVSASSDSQVVEQGAKGAAVAGAATAAGSVVRGSNNIARNTAAGAAAGAAGGAVHGAFKSNQLDPTFKNFVKRCLHERGYDVIGWK